MSKTVSYAQWSLEPYCIGMKLRSLRTQKRLTLSRLAAETKLSTALLSKLETDRMIPTLPTLATISRVYGVGMSYFFCEPAKHTLSITRKAHLQGNSRGLESVKVTPAERVLGEDPAGGADDRVSRRRSHPPPSPIPAASRAAGVCAGREVAVGCGRHAARCSRPAIAPIWKARWRWPGARQASTAADSGGDCRPPARGRLTD
jgi:transcriptional regulator with XRE-family HTH domain